MPEPAIAIDVTAYVVVSGLSVGDVCCEIILENCQAKSDGSNHGSRGGVLERGGIVDVITDSSIDRLRMNVDG